MIGPFRPARILAALLIAFAAPGAAQPPAAAPAAPAPAAASLTIEALAAPAYLTDPVLSPDGNRVAAQLTLNDKEWIAVWDVSEGASGPPRMLEQAGYNVLWMRWAGSGRLLIGILVVQTVYDIPVPVTRVVAIDVAAWRGIPLQTGRGMFADDVIFVDPAGHYALVSAQPSLFEYPAVQRIDLATGAATLVQRARTGVSNWFADRSGIVRAGVDYGENRIKFYYRSAAGEELRRIDSRRYPQDGSVIDMIRFVAEHDRGIVVTNAVTGRFAVYNYDFATDTRGEAIFEHPSVDVAYPIIGEDGAVDGVAFEDDRWRIHWIDPELRRIQANVDRALAGKVNMLFNQSADGNRMLVWSSAADDPGTYYIYDRRARRMDAFASPYSELNDLRFAPVRAVTYRTRDGLDVPGYLTLPPGRGERGLPLVVLPHGGPFLRDSWMFNTEVQFLASRGYAVLQPNFRGSTGYGRAYVERGYGQLGTGMVNDMEDGVDWLVGQGVVDPARVCIMGSSYGGYAAMWAAIRSPARYRCAISWAGPTDLRRMIRYDARYIVPQRYMREYRRQLAGEDTADLDTVSPLRQQARLSVPLLIGHGARDARVPVDQSRDLLRALERRGHAVESVIYPQAGHDFTKRSDSADFLRRIEAFLARHNPPAPAPARTAEAAPTQPPAR